VAITIDISDLITSVSVLIIGIMIAVVLWKISQLVDAVKENIKEAKKA
jgi:uncharacterized protein YoxC